MARLPNFLVIIRSEKLSGKGQGRGCLGVRKKERFVLGKRTFRSQKSKHFVLRIIDITQNVFLKIWEKRHEINPEQNFNAYLFTIARNMVYKETEQKLLAEQSLRQLQEEEDVLDMSTIQTLDYHFTEELCRSLVEELPPARREIFKLSRFERLSNKEIALRLSISERTVETQLYRATRFLKRKLLSDEGLGLLILLFIIQSN